MLVSAVLRGRELAMFTRRGLRLLQTIREVQPDVVVVELCQYRVSMLKMDESTLLREAQELSLEKLQQAVRQVRSRGSGSGSGSKPPVRLLPRFLPRPMAPVSVAVPGPPWGSPGWGPPLGQEKGKRLHYPVSGKGGGNGWLSKLRLGLVARGLGC